MPEKKNNKAAERFDEYLELDLDIDFVEARECDYFEGKEEIRRMFAEELKERKKDREFYDWDSQQFED